MSKIIVTITGIRPDFIRMSEIFKSLDESKIIKHIMIHTGQHYDKLLSDVFFRDLSIRKPDYILNTGKSSKNHYEQLSYLSTEIIELFNREHIDPDLIVFLGDSNSVCASLPLKKEGYKIGHVEAGMRSFDKRMLEEINRTVCDHCSDILFVYHEDYKTFLTNENIKENVHVVGNTIVEVARNFIPKETKRNDMILVDIHRPENFKFPNRLSNIIKYANICGKKYGLPVKMLHFPRTSKIIEELQIDTGMIEFIPLLSFKEYIKTIYHCKFIVSDSGTAQEEPALLKTPVIVPRDFTERPQSIKYDCSYMLDVNDDNNWEDSFQWISSKPKLHTEWLGDGETSRKVVKLIESF